jgi:PAS/PAC sensor hybrid histidine kinase
MEYLGNNSVNEAKFVLNTISIPTTIIDKNGRIILRNTAAKKFFKNLSGATESLCKFKVCPFKCSRLQNNSCIITEAAKKRKAVTREIYHDNEYYKVTATPAFNEKSEIVYITETIEKIDDDVRRKQISELALDASELLIWRYSVAEKKFYSVKGLPDLKKGISRREVFSRIPKSDLPYVKSQFSKLIEKKIKSAELTHRFKDFDTKESNTWTFIKAKIIPILDKENNVVELIGTRKNITENMDAAEIQAAMIDSIPIHFFAKDPDKNFEYIFSNSAHNEFVGRENIIGCNDFKIYKKKDTEQLRGHDSELAKSDTAQKEFAENICDYRGVKHALYSIKNMVKTSSGRRLMLGACVDKSSSNLMDSAIQISNAALSHVLSENDFDTNLKFILNLLKENNFCDRCTVSQIGKDGYLHFKTAVVSEKKYTLSKTAAEELAKVWKVVLPTLKNNEIWTSPFFEESKFPVNTQHFQIKSVAICPIFINETLWGAFSTVYIKNNKTFGEIDLNIIRTISYIIARAWQKSEAVLKLRNSEREQNIILDNISIPILLCDTSFNVLRENNAFVKDFKSLNTPSGENYDDFLRGLLDSPEDSLIKKVKETKKPVSQECNIFNRNYIVNVNPLFDETKKIAKYLVSAIDVTEKNKILFAEKILSHYMQNILNNVDYEISLNELLAMLKKYLIASKAYFTWFDFYKKSNRIMKKYLNGDATPILKKNLNIAENDPWIKMLKKKKCIRVEDTQIGDNEIDRKFSLYKRYKLESVYSYAITINGELSGAITIAYHKKHILEKHDEEFLRIIVHLIEAIFEKKVSQEQIETALKKSQEAERAKSYFLASMSHEIRTPLNAIIGFSDLLKDKNIDKNVQSKYSEYISFAARSLLDLINDVLDLSKLESGNFETTKELCDFGTLCASIIALFKTKFQQKNLASISKIDNIPPVYIDKRRIKQILFNLLGNALKFTGKGSIELDASFKKTAAKKGTLTFYIKDTGIGIRKEDAKNIFEPFVQVKSFRGTFAENNGTGLGLAICRQMLEKMGGSIDLKSEFGVGSVFTIKIKDIEYEGSLPDANKNEIKKPARTWGDLKTLLVDDVNMNLRVLKAMMLKIGSQVETTQSPLEAVKLAKKENFDIILTDMWMPKLDGGELAKKIKSFSPDTKIFAVTADMDTKSNFDTSALDGILIKPITIDRLRMLIDKISPKPPEDNPASGI